MKSSGLRNKFLEFFKEKDHKIVQSAPLVPVNDPTLLLINAGMAPLKPYFLDPPSAPSGRMASVQKCLRTNDIDEVGTTPRHLTFFEMLGNFSFGDYFKEEIITWSWEFVIEWLNLPFEKLFFSVYEKDDEAYDLWHKKVGVPESKIFRLGQEDNFWFMADTGPCGPDSEIFYDLGEGAGCGKPSCQPGCDCSRYTEIWNLVFTQFDRQEDGELKPLPSKNVDTGMGLERTIAAMDGKVSVFETDLFQPLISYIHEKSGFKGKTDTSGVIEFNPYFLMADHLRGSAFLIADGVYPGNDGRGYILRRIMRRAFVHAQKQGLKEGELIDGLKYVYETLGEIYPEIIEKSDLIEKILSREEEGFLSTLSRGEALLEKQIEKLDKTGDKILDGESAFELYDTYGFPLDLTRDILREKGYGVDDEGYNLELEKQRERSRADTAAKIEHSDKQLTSIIFGHPATVFKGYDNSAGTEPVLDILPNTPEHENIWPYPGMYAFILEATPFYAEAGGQVGDKGIIEGPSFRFTVSDTKSDENGVYQHLGNFVEGDLQTALKYISSGRVIVKVMVTESRRRGIMRAHSATHLMHAALRKTLGDHVKQAGSLVEEDRLRFDFSHYEPVSFDDLIKITSMVNEWIIKSLKIEASVMEYDDAVNAGAMALFGEKYDQNVRVISMGDDADIHSRELCGGTHASNTSQIGSFIITKEESIASGTRRIEALTGTKAVQHFLEGETILKELSARFAVTNDKIEPAVEKLFEERKSFEKELEKFRAEVAKSQAAGLIDRAEKIGDVSLLINVLDNIPGDSLMGMAESFKNKVDSYAALLIGKLPDKLAVTVGLSDNLVEKGIKAGDIIREICGILGGGGGGRPNLAQGGGKDANKIDDAIARFKEIIREKLS